MATGKRALGVYKPKVNSVINIRTVLPVTFSRGVTHAVVFRPVGLDAHRIAYKRRKYSNGDQDVEIDQTVKPAGPRIYITLEEAKAVARAAAAPSVVMVGVVLEGFAAHVCGKLAFRAEAMQYHFRGLGL